MPAAAALQFQILSHPQQFPFMGSAGMRFFHLQEISYVQFHQIRNWEKISPMLPWIV